MQVTIVVQRARLLRRTAAVVMIAGLSAGCSSGSMRFQDALFTSSTASGGGAVQTAAMQPQYEQQQYAQPQAYPDNSALQPANVDDTYTGSINRQAVQPVNMAARGVRKGGGHPVPTATVGNLP